MMSPYCEICWQEKQHCQCGNNVNKPQWAEWECPVCGKTDLECKCQDVEEIDDE